MNSPILFWGNFVWLQAVASWIADAAVVVVVEPLPGGVVVVELLPNGGGLATVEPVDEFKTKSG